MGIEQAMFSKKVNVTERGTPFIVGVHLATIIQMTLFNTYKKGPAFVAKFNVKKSTTLSPDVLKDDPTRIWYQGLNGLSESVGLGEIYKLCFAASGLDLNTCTPADKNAAQASIQNDLLHLETKQAFAGLDVTVVTFKSAPTADGKTYVNSKFAVATAYDILTAG